MLKDSLILASASPARASILKQAGFAIRIEPANIDERDIKAGLAEECAPAGDMAALLARLKAERVSGRAGADLVIGADQILRAGDDILNKPRSKDEARDHLMILRGNTHDLISAVSIACEGRQIWSHQERARLTMRPFSDDFLDRYLEMCGEEILASVGAYRLEGLGAHLFSRIEGDYFTILGLPLLPVLEFLRLRGVLAS